MQRLLIEDGWLVTARKVPSPNYNPRPPQCQIGLIVIHNISLPPAQFGGGYIEQFFQNQLDPSIHPYFAEIKDLQVSAHLLITRTGEVIQFVSLNDRAWHAGHSCYQGMDNCNDFSIGIELEGSDDQPFTEAQYQALVPLLEAIQQNYPATCGHVAGHNEIAPNRKTDPGACFDWSRIRPVTTPMNP